MPGDTPSGKEKVSACGTGEILPGMPPAQGAVISP